MVKSTDEGAPVRAVKIATGVNVARNTEGPDLDLAPVLLMTVAKDVISTITNPPPPHPQQPSANSQITTAAQLYCKTTRNSRRQHQTSIRARNRAAHGTWAQTCQYTGRGSNR